MQKMRDPRIQSDATRSSSSTTKTTTDTTTSTPTAGTKHAHHINRNMDVLSQQMSWSCVLDRLIEKSYLKIRQGKEVRALPGGSITKCRWILEMLAKEPEDVFDRCMKALRPKCAHIVGLLTGTRITYLFLQNIPQFV